MKFLFLPEIPSKLRTKLFKAQLKQQDSSELIMFDMDSILVATNDFSVTNKLGEGGFGPVYKVITTFFILKHQLIKYFNFRSLLIYT